MAMELSTRSYWLGLDPYEPDAPLEGEMRADVVIVGAGFSGLWTAYHLLKEDPGMTVVVIEASAVGYGASGRNGGFAMTLIHHGLKDLVAAVGAEEARALHLAAEEAIRSIGRVCETENIDADLQPNGLLTVPNTPLQDTIVREEVDTAARRGPSGSSAETGPASRPRPTTPAADWACGWSKRPWPSAAGASGGEPAKKGARGSWWS